MGKKPFDWVAGVEAQLRAELLGSSATAPLDLTAVEREQALLQEEMRRPPGVTTLRQEWEAHHVGPMLGLLDRAEAAERNMTALLAHCRALRAALTRTKEFATEIERATPLGDAHTCAQHIQHEAMVVLAAARDGEVP